MRRFFLKHIPENQSFELPEEESKHMIRVLRMNVGDTCVLLDGKGQLVDVQINDAHPKRCGVTVLSREQKTRSSEFHLAIAPTKNNDRMEWMVEKIVEVGATKLSFISGDHSERFALKLDRLERVAISAMKQAQHDFLLTIEPMIAFDEFIKQNPTGKIAHCMDTNKKALQSSIITGPILIGPEGDFSPREIELAQASGYEAIHLGTARLRTETAGLVATVLAIHQ